MKKIKDSNEEYHSHNSISASGLKTIYKKSINHYFNMMVLVIVDMMEDVIMLYSRFETCCG